jgi:peptidoglycan/LPS O-acetylase OafA/YrhL
MDTAVRNELQCATPSAEAGERRASRNEIVPLTGLRGLAAAWVFAYHAIQLTKNLDPAWTLPLRIFGSAGYLGVDLFFVLSGFVIAYNYAATPVTRSPRAYFGFLWKRIARIWPAHTAALLFFACGLAIYSSVPFDLSLTGFLRSLTMTQAWEFPGRQIWNPVAWSVSCEWAAYLVFPLVAIATRRLPLSLAILGIPALYVVLYGAFVIGPWGEGPFSLGLQRVAVSFTAGALVHRIWCLRKVSIDPLGWLALGAMIIGASVVDLSIRPGYSVTRAVILSCVIVYALACSRGALAKVFARLRYAGCISYSFYLVHWVLLAIANTLLVAAHVTANFAWVSVAILASLLSAVALADCLYRHVEEPARRWLVSLASGERWRRLRRRATPISVSMLTRR